jgi:hypothetical protein
VAAKPWVVSDGLWERVEPLLPKVERRRHPDGSRRLVLPAAEPGEFGEAFILFGQWKWRVSWRRSQRRPPAMPAALPPAL